MHVSVNSMCYVLRRPHRVLIYSYKSHEDDDSVSLPHSAAAATSTGVKITDDRRLIPGGLLNSTEIDASDNNPLYDASIGTHSELSIDFEYYGSTRNTIKYPIA